MKNRKLTLLQYLTVLLCTGLLFLLAFFACNEAKHRPGKILFDRVPFVYATINGQRELFMIDTGASVSMLDKTFCDDAGIYYAASGVEIIGVNGASVPQKLTGRIPFQLDSIPYSARFSVQDMTSLRRAAGRNIKGLIGSDVLSAYHISIDFKNYELVWE